MKLIIDIPEDVYKKTVFYREFKDLNDCVTTIKALENGTPIPDNATICDIEQIRAEIEQMDFDFGDFYDHTETIREMVLKVIDKYKTESEDKE